jgi:hypothetical protein
MLTFLFSEDIEKVVFTGSRILTGSLVVVSLVHCPKQYDPLLLVVPIGHIRFWPL